jgi:hypothetical protein
MRYLNEMARVGESLTMMNHFKAFCSLSVALAATIASCGAAQTVYTKNEDLPALRLRYSDLEGILAKASRLATEANRQTVLSSNFLDRFTMDYGREFEKGEAQRFAEKQRQRILAEFPREGIVISAAGEDLSLADHLVTKATGIPQEASSMTYRYDFYSDSMPIASVSLLFNDSFRRVEVRGSAEEHVDAVMNTLRADLLRFSTRIGGSRFRLTAGMIMTMVLSIMGMISLPLISSKRSLGWVLLVCSVVLLLAVTFLPFDRWLPGFAAYRDDPAFLIRYGPEIGFAGLVVSALGVLIGVYQLSTAKSEDSSTKKRTVKRAARSKSESAQSK